MTTKIKAGPRKRVGKPPTTHTPADNPDGLPLLRTSERRDFKRCPQRWAWSWQDGLRPKGPPAVALWFGTGWHLVMAHWYQAGKKRGANPLKVWRDWVGDELPRIRVNIPGDAEYREEVYMDGAALGEEMIGNYLDRYGKDERWHVIQVEKPFEVVIVNAAGQRRVLFCGTYDGVYIDEKDGSVWLMEHKTAKQIRTNHLTLDNQAGGYLMVATRELRHAGLITPKQQVRGIMYNFARKAPADPRPRNADGLCTNNPTKQHYIDALTGVDNWEAPVLAKMKVDELEGIAAGNMLRVLGDVSKVQPSPLFHREPIRRTTPERNSILRGIQAEVESMEAMRTGTLPLYKNQTMDCPFCPYHAMCILHEAGNRDWEELRDTQYATTNPYADHMKSAQDGDD